MSVTAKELEELGFTPRTPVVDTEEEKPEEPKEDTTALVKELEALGFKSRTAPEETKKETKTTAPKKTEDEIAEERRKEREEVAFGTSLPATTQLSKEELEAVKPKVSGDLPTTREGLYYSGPEGQRLKEREQQLRNRKMGPGGTGEFTQITGGLSQEEEKELADIEAAKQERYDKIQGENVTDLGPLGKFVTDDQGTSTYIPGPNSTEAGDVYRKFASDTLRGILGTPELLGLEGFQDVVPKVNSEDEAVIVLSEIAQFSVGGYGAFTAAQKVPKLEKLAEKMPAFKAFIDTPTSTVGKLGKSTAERAVKIANRAVPKGTLSAGTGAMVTADEDVSTFFGDDDMPMAEAKLRVLQDSLLIGGALSAIGAAPGIVSGIPLVKTAVGATYDTFSILFAGQSKVDQAIAKRLGEASAETLEEMRNAKTPEEVLAAKEKLYAKVNEELKNKTNMTFDEYVEKMAADDVPQSAYVPTAGELLEDEQLIRIYNGLRLKRGSREADIHLSNLLGQNRQERIDAIKAQAQTARTELAPRGRKTAEEVREEVAKPAVTSEEQMIAQMERAQQEEALQASRAATQQIEEAPVQAQRQEAETAKVVQKTLEDSPVASSNVDTLNNFVDEDGVVQPIRDVLRADLETKKQLGAQLDEAYQAVPVPGDEALNLVADIERSMDRSLLTSSEQIQKASAPVRRLLAKYSEQGDEVVKTEVDNTLMALQNAQTDEQFFAAIRGFGQKLDEAGTELPQLTAKDLLDVQRAVNSQSRELAKTSQQVPENATINYELSQALKNVGATLDAQIQNLTQGSEAAVNARNQFDTFFRDQFSERWRTATGREWQGSMLGANTEVDMQTAIDKVARVVSNPNMSQADFTQVRNIVREMEPQAQSQFAQGLQNRVVAGFKPKGVSFSPEETKSVREAEQLLRQLDGYLTGTRRYQELLPDATAPLVQLRNQLEESLAPARQAREAARTAAQKAKVDASTLNAQQQRAFSEIASARRDAETVLAKSAVNKLTGYEGEPAEYFVSLLNNKKTGPKEVQELWTRTGMIGEKGEDGITPAQRKVKESVIEALLRKSYTPVQEGQKSGKVELRYLEEQADPNSAVGKTINIVTKGDPRALQLLKHLKNQVASSRRAEGEPFTSQSVTAEKQAFENQLMDVQTVLFGPLTRRARFARFMTKIGMNLSGLDNKIADSYAKMLTDPRQTKLIIDYAAQAKRSGMIPEDKAINDTMVRLLMAQQGYREYLDATRGDDGSLIFRIEDPIKDLIRRAESDVVVEQMEDIMPSEGQDSSVQPES